MPQRLVPAELSFDGDGTPYSTQYNDVYHSAQGGLQQARHVFLGGNDLPARWRESRSFTILETGFGLGLNFLATWQAWCEAGSPGRLHFVSVEKHPFARNDLAAYWQRVPELAGFAEQMLAQWPPLVPGCQRLHFDDGRVTLTLLFGDAEDLLPKLVARIDAVYLDGFAPAKNHELWSAKVLSAISALAAPQATLATWSVAGELRRLLEAQGWHLERREGFGGKREMLCGWREGNEGITESAIANMHVRPEPVEGRGGLRQAQPERTQILNGRFDRTRRAIVIGAGLAGAAVSERLASRGWQVDLIERHAAPAQEASGNRMGIVFPFMTRDDALAARFSRSCFLYALRRLAELPSVRWSPCGVLQLARDAAHEIVQRATVDELGLPSDFIGFLEQSEAEAKFGQSLPSGGWWFPGGSWVSPVSFCHALLEAGGASLRIRYSTEVATLHRVDGQWQALSNAERVIAEAPHVVLANAHAANRLLSQNLPLTPIRGQVSLVPAALAPAIPAVLCRTGYLTPTQDGVACLGASFGRDDADLSLRVEDHRENLLRLEEMIPGAAVAVNPETLSGRVGVRTATIDRQALVGTMPDIDAKPSGEPNLASLPRAEGLHALLGLGARGMVWAPLCAELLASQLEGEPLPVERELVDAIDPARFHLKKLRRAL